jgi:two-component system invasion response regulator UvrY
MISISNIVLVDDHVLLRKALAALIMSMDSYNVLFEADNGIDFINKLNPDLLPDLVLLDLNMPEKDGVETAQWLKNSYPSIKVLALSMYDNENAIIRMFKAGARGYILKYCEPEEMKAALDSIILKGFYYSEMVTGKLIHSINNLHEEKSQIRQIVRLNERETTFLKLICSDLTYKEVADKMFLSTRTVEGYRDTLFERLQVKSRVGLVLYAIKNGIVTI